MGRILIFLLMICLSKLCSAQLFEMPEGVDEVEIPVEIVSNILIIDIKVNGTEMKFILDSGATRTTIFNINGVDSLSVGSGERTLVQGYGSMEPFEAINSTDNILSINNLKSTDAEIFVLTEEQISFLSILGVEVNGILGVDFFKGHLVELDYKKERVTVFSNENSRIKNKYKSQLDLNTDRDKPYLKAKVINNNTLQELDLLIDTGSGDALWLFENSSNFEKPTKGFRDYLGFGLSGEVYGFRSKINLFTLGDYNFEKVTIAFPESENNILLAANTIARGSIGGEVLRRFKVLIDYNGKMIFFDKNNSFKDGFYYNMAGIKLKEGDKELISKVNYNFNEVDNKEARSIEKISSSINRTSLISFSPKVLVSYIIPNSIADKSGIEVGDQIISFNGKNIGRFNMGEVSQSFYKKPYSTIRLKLKRGEEIYSVKLRLVPLVEID